MSGTILIVDDEQDMLNLLKRSLEPDLHCKVETAASAEMALQMLKTTPYDLILADIMMPGMSGLELLEIVRRKGIDTTIIMMTAYGHIDMAVQAMKSGAHDFIAKPFEHDALVVRLEKALERSRLLKENLRLQRECHGSAAFQDMVGTSTRMKQVYETIRTLARTDLTVLITGESGTGKDITAKAIHGLSNRSRGPYVAVNCPTVPENILESELFGYKKGAFTHATQNRSGLFQEAHGGTIFLDEIGDISPPIQTKLLRVIQEKEFKPLGDTKSIHVDVRVVASTNQNLKEKIEKKEFREDLYYRLNVLPVKLPPLRERIEDIPLIASHLVEKHCTKLDKRLKSISPELMDRFMKNPWEGNVRELENVIIRGILFSMGDEIVPEDVGLRDPKTPDPGFSAASFKGLMYKSAKKETLMRFNNSYIGALLSESGGNVTQAAKRCGLDRQSLQQIMRRYGIKADDYRK